MQIPNLLRDFEPKLKGVKDAYLKLNKSLYGLKQAPREWFYIVKKFFKNIGLKAANTNPNLFIGNKAQTPRYHEDKNSKRMEMQRPRTCRSIRRLLN